jgi:hypothetical protein
LKQLNCHNFPPCCWAKNSVFSKGWEKERKVFQGVEKCISLRKRNGRMGCSPIYKKERDMKITKWLIALVAVMMFVGCAKSDEQKAKDAAEAAQKDAQKALDGIKVPSMK